MMHREVLRVDLEVHRDVFIMTQRGVYNTQNGV